MHKFLSIGCCFVLLMLASIPQAAASYYVWGDDAQGINLTFPDNWQVVVNQKPDEVLSIVAPEADGYVSCEFKMREDRRYRVYPQRYDEAISEISYGRDFWQDYIAKHDRVQFHVLKNDAGYGRGHGSYALVSYTTGYPQPFEERASLMFVGFYNANVHIAECSAPILLFEKWNKAFYSIIGSVEFRKDYNELTIGHYKDFLSEGLSQFIFQDRKSGVTTRY